MAAIQPSEPEDDVRTFTDLAQLEDAVGEELGTSDWIEITQERVIAHRPARSAAPSPTAT